MSFKFIGTKGKFKKKGQVFTLAGSTTNEGRTLPSVMPIPLSTKINENKNKTEREKEREIERERGER